MTPQEPHPTELRAAAAVAGWALLGMIVIAPLGLLVGLPRGHTGAAALSVMVIAMLDVVAAVALVPVLTGAGRMLALIGAGLRITYAAGFAAAATNLVGVADPAQFDAAWDLVLLIFGVHLIAVGTSAVLSRLVPTWIGVLVLIAGGAYLIDAVLVVASVALPMPLAGFAFVGEVALCVWLLVLAASGRRRSRADR